VGTTADATGKCVAPSNDNYQQLIPSSGTNFQINSKTLTTTISSEVLLSWVDSRDLIDEYTSVESFEIRGSSGTFTVAHRQGQATGLTDRFGWEMALGSTSATIKLCTWRNGGKSCTNPGTYPFSSGTGQEVQHVMTLDADDNIRSYITWRPSPGSYYWLWGYLSRSNFPNTGAIAYGITGNIALSDIKLVTSTAIEISLSDCISNEEWERLFFALSLADQSSTSYEYIRQNGGSTCAKEASHGKALVSSFTFVISSAGAPASAIAQSFMEAAAVANTPISSMAILPGTESAIAAGIPLNASPAGG